MTPDENRLLNFIIKFVDRASAQSMLAKCHIKGIRVDAVYGWAKTTLTIGFTSKDRKRITHSFVIPEVKQRVVPASIYIELTDALGKIE